MNRLDYRQKVQSRRKNEVRRAKDMTVCIAALYNDDAGRAGIALVNDWQITDTHTSFKSKGLKVAMLTQYIAIMGAGDMTYFGDLVNRTTDKLKGKPGATVEEAAEVYWDSEIDWQNEYREHHVLGKYNLNWESYFHRLENNLLPEAFFAEVNRDLKSAVMPFGADAILAGVNRNSKTLRIIKIENGIKDLMVREGYAVIGEGNTVVTAEFGYADYNPRWSKAQTVYLCYAAKKRSEVIASVGDISLISLFDHRGLHVLPSNYKTQLDKVWKGQQKSRKGAEDKAYEKAKAIIKDYDQNYADKNPGEGAGSAESAVDG